MKHTKNILWFEEVNKDDVGIVGGKGANLGEMTNTHLPIPYGFVVTSKAYFDFIRQNQLEAKIKALLHNINCENQKELQEASVRIQKLIKSEIISKDLAHDILNHYQNLSHKEEQYLKEKTSVFKEAAHKVKSLYKSPLVAVRSSATAEDLPNASFAGQQDTYLNVEGENVLIQKIRDCWASLFTERAIYYRHEQKFDHMKVGIAVVIQRMVQSEKSGVAFSIDPVTNDKNKIVIEAILGLGELIVQGKVTPDHYEIDKRSFVITKKDIKYQNSQFVQSGSSNKELKLSKSQGSVQKINEEEILKLSFLVKDIEKHYFFPQDIEWAIEGKNVFIVQSRPITTVKDQQTAEKQTFTNSLLATGSPASPGIGVGPVTYIASPKEIHKMKQGDILLASQTNPDYVPAMKKAAAIVTEKGGRTSHAAIVSRELGVPAIVGAENAIKILKNEKIVSVNGATGEVYKGSIISKKNGHANGEKKQVKRLKTLTKIYVNLAQPDQAERVAAMDADGIGLLRAEFIIADIGKHPKQFIKEKNESVFIRKLAHELEKFTKPFAPRQIIYRATDFKTNEYRNLEGGKAYEHAEENPMLGFRGAYRYIANEDVFIMELEAIKQIWKKGYNNLHLMIPFIRTTWEFIKVRQIVEKYGMFELHGFKLWIMVEVPSCALGLEEFIKLGVDGVSIGTNDLTMMLMGVDRDNEEVAPVYDERQPVVMSVLEYVVKTCSKYGITSSICGQAPSDYSEITEMLVRSGITSLSVNPDAIDRTRQLVFDIEKNLFDKISKAQTPVKITGV